MKVLDRIKKALRRENIERLFFKPEPHKQSIIVNNVNVRPVHRESQDIQKWRSALISAEAHTQQRTRLYNLYDDMLLDGHLRAVVDKRIRAVTNRELVFVRDGVEDEEITKMTNKSYFEDFLREVMNARFWGHSLIEPIWPARGADAEGETLLVPRKHVKPMKGIVTRTEYDQTGMKYREPPFKDKVIEVGGPWDLGLLLQASQYVIYKRGNFGDWAEFAEVFGMPFRWATYNNPETREILETALAAMGSAGYAVAPEDATLNFVQPNSNQGTDIFRFLRKACNEEISITILGQTMTTTEASSSGYAQSQTHMEVEEEINKDDRMFVCRILNEKVSPFLARLGYNTKDGEWMFKEEETLSLKERLDIDLAVSEKVDIDPDYWYERYHIPKPAQKKKADLISLAEHYHPTGCNCAGCLNLADTFDNRFRKIPTADQTSLAMDVYQGAAGTGQVHRQFYSHYFDRLKQFTEAGYGRALTQPRNRQEFELFQRIKKNISDFSGLKQRRLISDLSALRNLPQAEYLRRAQRLMKDFNEDYLEAELVTALSAAQSAESWAEIQRRARLYPNLRYETAGDERVRESHKSLDQAVYPINHPFWDSFMPPNGYRCRCKVVQTDQPVNMQEGDVELPRAFRNNPGKTGQLFAEDHPYYEQTGAVRAMQQSDQVRAEVEKEIMKGLAVERYKGADFKLPSLPKTMRITEDGIGAALDATHSLAPALKNELLTVLTMIVNDLRFHSRKETSWRYHLTLLGYDFYFVIEQQGDDYILTSITDTI